MNCKTQINRLGEPVLLGYIYFNNKQDLITCSGENTDSSRRLALIFQ